MKNIKREHIIYIAVAVLIVVVIVGYLLTTTFSGSALIGTPVSAATVSELQQIANNNTLANNVGAGIAVAGGNSNLPQLINATPLSFNGKPEILYVGGEFCPYCGITRWGLILALMRFGNFSNLTYEASSSKDVYPNTPTFSFLNSTYQSKLLHFDGIEAQDRLGNNITNVNFTDSEKFIYGRFSTGGIPFIDFANYSIQSGAVVSPQIVQGSGWNRIIENLSNPNTPDSQAIIGNANIFTAFICRSNQTLNATAAACKQNYLKTIPT